MTNEQTLTQIFEQLSKELNINFGEDFKNWYLPLVLQASKESPESFVIIKKKLEHCFYTVLNGREIAKGTSEIKWDFEIIDAVCFLHDVGRFHEAVNNPTLEMHKGLDHGDLGAEIVRVANIKNFNRFKKDIVEAIGAHSKRLYLGKNIYAKLVRDADKVSDMLEIDWYLKFRKDSGIEGKGLSDKEWSSFAKHEEIYNEDVKTTQEMCLQWITWFYDINYVAASKILIKNKILEKLFDTIKTYGITYEQEKIIAQEISKIKEVAI